MRWMALGTVLLLGMAGCGGKTADSSSPSATGTSSSGVTSTHTTTTAPPGPESAQLAADVTSGLAPLNVTFTLKATGDIFSWRLGYGDGSTPESGTGAVPASRLHKYAIGGNFTALLNVTFKD